MVNDKEGLKNIVKLVSKTNNVIKVCDYCKNHLMLAENDILFDRKWYHGHCWEEKTSKSKNYLTAM